MSRGDILLISLPISDGREQSGRRPAVAVQTDLTGQPMLMVAPTTSNLSASIRIYRKNRANFRKRTYAIFNRNDLPDAGN